MNHERAQLEKVGVAFDIRKMLEAQQRARAAIREIADQIKPGIAEEEAHALARAVLKNNKLLRGWHAVHVRIGNNTLKHFGAPSEPGIILQDNDIFFIDIGPVWEKWEGDGGETFVVGTDSDMHRIAADVRSIFAGVADVWRNEGLTGKELYERAGSLAQTSGWQLNLDMNGHRLGEFPHAAIYDGGLSAVPFRPSSGLWVLEIQIRHPSKAFGAFYEDLLVK